MPIIQYLSETRSNDFSFKHQGYCCLSVFKNYTNKKFYNFYRVFYNVWTIYGNFSFFKFKAEIDLSTLDHVFQFNLFSLYEIYSNNNNKTQYKNKYLEAGKLEEPTLIFASNSNEMFNSGLTHELSAFPFYTHRKSDIFGG